MSGSAKAGEAGALVADLSTPKGRRLIVLGSGTSTGVPVIGCDCPVCQSDDPRNKRTRSSVLVQLPLGNLLIDTSPEMRLQLVRERVGLVHAIAYTHHHVDHLFGLDDARMFPHKLGGPVPIYCEPRSRRPSAGSSTTLSRGGTGASPAGGVPQIEFERIGPGVPFSVLGQSKSCRSGSTTAGSRSSGSGSATSPIAPTSAQSRRRAGPCWRVWTS